MEQAERQKKLEIIQLLKGRISIIKTYGDKMDITSWHDHEGVLITGDHAQIILDTLIADTDDRVRATGALPDFSDITDKIKSLIRRFRKKKYPDPDKFAEIEREFS